MSNPHIQGSDLFNRLGAQKRERVLDAALLEFSENGYKNASVNAIVKQAGISKGSFFHYFGTKKGLFDAIVEAAIGQVKVYLRTTRQETEALDIFKKLELLLLSGFSFIEKWPRLASIYFHALQSNQSPFAIQRTLEIQMMGVRFIEELLVEASEKGEIRPNVDITAVSFMMNAVFERSLRSYYTEILDPGLGLYMAKQERLEQWASIASNLFKEGLLNR